MRAAWPAPPGNERDEDEADDTDRDQQADGERDHEMKLIIAFVKPFKLEQVRDALKAVGVSGMSVGDISGFGRQGGQTEVYRGAEYEVEFVPKIRLEVIVTDELATSAVTAIESAAHTGDLGDGKIVVVALEDVVRIRTGERGADAV
jgi:nitrogen regulatory protein PII